MLESNSAGNRRRSVTMADVATYAGVSIATVSFVVNNTKQISQETRTRITDAMNELGYRRNALARALASRKSNILALLYPVLDHDFRADALPFFTSAAETAHSFGYKLVLWPSTYEPEEVREVVGQGLIDGVILMEVMLNDSRIPPLEEGTVPFVLLGRPAKPREYHHVDIDFAGTIRDCIDYLRSLGHQQISMITGEAKIDIDPQYGPGSRRRKAYRGLAKTHGFRPIIVPCTDNFLGGLKASKEVIKQAADTTAVLVMNDDSLSGVIAGFEEQSRKVPDDVSVLAITASGIISGRTNPPLTTMLYPAGILGELAVKRLVRCIENPEAPLESVLASSTLTIRGTTGAAPKKYPALHPE